MFYINYFHKDTIIISVEAMTTITFAKLTKAVHELN